MSLNLSFGITRLEAQSTTEEKETKFLLVGYGIASAVDIYSTGYGIGKGSVHETNFLLKPVVHKPLAFGLLKGSLDAAVILAILKVSENHPNTAKWMARISLGGRIAVDVNNIRVVMKF